MDLYLLKIIDILTILISTVIFYNLMYLIRRHHEMRMLRIRSTDWILIRDIIISVILALIVSTSGHWLHDYFASKTIETVELETVGVYG